MKKITLRVATLGLLVGALFFSFSPTTSGHFKAVQSAKASELYYALYQFPCPYGGYTSVCGPGGAPYCLGTPCPQPVQ